MGCGFLRILVVPHNFFGPGVSGWDVDFIRISVVSHKFLGQGPAVGMWISLGFQCPPGTPPTNFIRISVYATNYLRISVYATNFIRISVYDTNFIRISVYATNYIRISVCGELCATNLSRDKF